MRLRTSITFMFCFQSQEASGSMPHDFKINFSMGLRKSNQVFSPLKTRAQWRPNGTASITDVRKMAIAPSISVFIIWVLKFLGLDQCVDQVNKYGDANNKQCDHGFRFYRRSQWICREWKKMPVPEVSSIIPSYMLYLDWWPIKGMPELPVNFK